MVIVRRIILFGILVLLGLSLSTGVSAQGSPVYVLNIEGTIVPVIADYIEDGINRAEEANAAVCVIELDTPGGLLNATEDIVQSILNTGVPVVVFVHPAGSWAASAGTFITLSANIAAMTPGTTIGAAHPVSAGGEEISEDEMKKVVEFSAKWMKTIAEQRNRNIEEAQLAVTESKSFTDNDALNADLIDLRAYDLEDLLTKINGWEVTLANGAELTIDTTSYQLVYDEMGFIESFLQAISDPNIAYLLLSIATLGIMAEIFNPGLIFPGILGGISLLLAFYSLGVLPVNYAGILFIALAVGLFIGEVLTTTFGLFTAGGVVSLIIGSLILFKGASPEFQIDPWLIAIVSIIVAGVMAFIVHRAIVAHRKQAKTGREELIGKTALVKATLKPEGMVLYKGERWTAISDSGEIKKGEEVVIDSVDGLLLHVSKKQPAG